MKSSMFDSRTLCQLQAEAGKTNRELAVQCCVSVETYCRWRTGKLQPRLKKLALLARALGVERKMLTGGKA